jgi:hypothetical protein
MSFDRRASAEGPPKINGIQVAFPSIGGSNRTGRWTFKGDAIS